MHILLLFLLISIETASTEKVETSHTRRVKRLQINVNFVKNIVAHCVYGHSKYLCHFFPSCLPLPRKTPCVYAWILRTQRREETVSPREIFQVVSLDCRDSTRTLLDRVPELAVYPKLCRCPAQRAALSSKIRLPRIAVNKKVPPLPPPRRGKFHYARFSTPSWPSLRRFCNYQVHSLVDVWFSRSRMILRRACASKWSLKLWNVYRVIARHLHAWNHF